MKVKKVLVSQPRPAVIEKSPFYELSEKYNVEIAYKPFIRVVGVSLKEFRAQRVEILTHTAVIFTSRTTVDSFFHICEEARITVPETMKYICQTEAVALYLQKYIVYRKRKISFADGSFTSIVGLKIYHNVQIILLKIKTKHKTTQHKNHKKKNGDHVHIDIGWKSVCGMICGCYLEKADGSIHYYYHPLKKDGTPGKAVRSTFVGCKLTKL